MQALGELCKGLWDNSILGIPRSGRDPELKVAPGTGFIWESTTGRPERTRVSEKLEVAVLSHTR